MKSLLLSTLVAAVTLTAFATQAQAHPHRVCHFEHHHRVCHWVR
jgi:hypothetical protein